MALDTRQSSRSSSEKNVESNKYGVKVRGLRRNRSKKGIVISEPSEAPVVETNAATEEDTPVETQIDHLQGTPVSPSSQNPKSGVSGISPAQDSVIEGLGSDELPGEVIKALPLRTIFPTEEVGSDVCQKGQEDVPEASGMSKELDEDPSQYLNSDEFTQE